MKQEEIPCIGVSQCLTDEPVRYDGRHKLSHHVVYDLGQYFRLCTFCPEVGAGMGVPRPPIHIVYDKQSYRAVIIENPEMDVTDAILEYSQRISKDIDALCGYVFKSRSPSCGLDDTPVYAVNKQIQQYTSGLFCDYLQKLYPEMPVTDETKLANKVTRGEFIKRVYKFFYEKKKR